MELKDKKVAFLGDSITEGYGTSAPQFRYTDVFARLSGADVTTNGIGGTRYAVKKKPSPDPHHDLDFVLRVDELPKNAEIVGVFGGTNDFGHGDAPLGKFEDRTQDTCYGACHVLYRAVSERFPDAFIFIMTPLHRLSEDATVNEIGLPCHPMKDFVQAEREVAEYYSLPVLDLYKESGLQPAVPAIRELYLPDGLHPNDRGAELLAQKILAFLRNR